MRTYMTWNDEYKGKVVSVEEAVKKVKSGDVVGFGLSLGSPTSYVVDALLNRANECRGGPDHRCRPDPPNENSTMWNS